MSNHIATTSKLYVIGTHRRGQPLTAHVCQPPPCISRLVGISSPLLLVALCWVHSVPLHAPSTTTNATLPLALLHFVLALQKVLLLLHSTQNSAPAWDVTHAICSGIHSANKARHTNKLTRTHTQKSLSLTFHTYTHAHIRKCTKSVSLNWHTYTHAHIHTCTESVSMNGNLRWEDYLISPQQHDIWTSMHAIYLCTCWPWQLITVSHFNVIHLDSIQLSDISIPQLLGLPRQGIWAPRWMWDYPLIMGAVWLNVLSLVGDSCNGRPWRVLGGIRPQREGPKGRIEDFKLPPHRSGSKPQVWWVPTIGWRSGSGMSGLSGELSPPLFLGLLDTLVLREIPTYPDRYWKKHDIKRCTDVICRNTFRL